MIAVIPGCNADIVLAVDKSGSISDPNRGGSPQAWGLVKDSLVNIMRSTNFGQPDGTRFGLVYFANNANLFLTLDQCFDIPCATTQINRASGPVSKII